MNSPAHQGIGVPKIPAKSQPMKRLVILLLVLFQLHLAESQPVTTATEIINDSTRPISQPSNEEREQLWTKIDNEYPHLYLLEYSLLQNDGYKIHDGNLKIDGDFLNEDCLIVRGDLEISGTYDDGVTGQLIVLGDMKAKNVLSEGTLAVTGHLTTDELIYAFYNDFIFEVGGEIRGRALFIYDKSYNFQDEALKTELYADTESELTDPRLVLQLAPELIAETYADSLGEEFDIQVPDWSSCKDLIIQGKSIFRAEAADDSLLKRLAQVLQYETEDEVLMKASEVDESLRILLADRPEVSPELQQKLVESGEVGVLQCLAKNPSTTPKNLGRIAESVESTRAYMARNPKAPASIVTKLVADKDPEVRAAAAERNDLELEEATLLANDSEEFVRLRLVQNSAVYLLDDDTIDKLCADEDSDVVQALLFTDGLLEFEHFQRLSEHPEATIRSEVAEALAKQALWKRRPTLTTAEREQLAEKLIEFPAVAPALSADKQHEIGAQWLDDPNRHYYSKSLAAETTSLALMKMHLNGAPLTTLAELGSNLALPPELQMKLVERLQPTHHPRPAIDEDGWVEQGEETVDAVVSHLVQNDNVSDEALIAIAEYSRKVEGKARFAIEILHHRDLPAEALDALSSLDNIYDYHSDWALTALRSPRVTRELLRKAVNKWYDDEDELLEEFSAIDSSSGEAFWNALTEAKDARLREIAASNLATPLTSLLLLSNDVDDEVCLELAGNRNFPISHEMIADEPELIVRHPNSSEEQILDLVERAREEDDDLEADRMLEILARRKLRTASR